MSRILNNTKALISIIAVLLLANIAMVIFFVATKPGAPHKIEIRSDQGRERLSYILKYELMFDSVQLKQFDSLKKDHWTSFKPLLKGINNSKDGFYKHLSDSVIDANMLRSAADSIAIRQRIMDMQVFNYFRNVRELCNEQQKPAYDSVIQNVVKRMIGAPNFRRGDNIDPRRDIRKDSSNQIPRP